jgi:colicin import membrane protein
VPAQSQGDDRIRRIDNSLDSQKGTQMSEQHPAGWYPQQDGSQRYWTGSEWTELRPSAEAKALTEPSGNPARHWYQKKRVIIPAAGLALLVGIGALQGGQGGATPAAAPIAATSSATSTDAPSASTPSVAISSEPAASPTPEETTASPTEEPSEESEDLSEDEAEAEADDPGYTVSQEQAIDKAAEYLDFTAFSKSGLIAQLKFEGFSKADASFAVEHVNVDWNEQAELKAQDYLDYTSFSRSGLIDQLEFEGFTHKQAVHGVNSVGL